MHYSYYLCVNQWNVDPIVAEKLSAASAITVCKNIQTSLSVFRPLINPIELYYYLVNSLFKKTTITSLTNDFDE